MRCARTVCRSVLYFSTFFCSLQNVHKARAIALPSWPAPDGPQRSGPAGTRVIPAQAVPGARGEGHASARDGVDLTSTEQLWRKGRGRVQEKVYSQRSRLHSADLLSQHGRASATASRRPGQAMHPSLQIATQVTCVPQIRIPSPPREPWLRAGPGRDLVARGVVSLKAKSQQSNGGRRSKQGGRSSPPARVVSALRWCSCFLVTSMSLNKYDVIGFNLEIDHFGTHFCYKKDFCRPFASKMEKGIFLYRGSTYVTVGQVRIEVILRSRRFHVFFGTK